MGNSTEWNKNLFMTTSQMRDYDRIAMEEVGIPGPVLMENAGAKAAEVIVGLLGRGATVAVVCGPGNNGGDGFVIARHLINAGFEVTVFCAAARNVINGDAAINLTVLESMLPVVVDISQADALTALAEGLDGCELVVDSLLGTGVSRNVEGHLGDIIDVINTTAAEVVAIDIPSGLDADSGRPWGKSVEATATVTFGHLKRGLVLYPGADLAGQVHTVAIGVPAFVSHKAGFDGTMITTENASGNLPIRPADAHKGTVGHLLLIAGSLGKTGAAILASQAAMRVGAGLVTIGTSAEAQPIIESRCIEAMVEPIVERTDAPLSEKIVSRLEQFLEGKKALAVGPGISTSPGISALTLRLLQAAEVPAVVDADGVNIIAQDLTAAGRITTPMIFTPHPGEMARLTNKTVASVQADRIGAALEAAKWHQVIIVLKGAHTVIAAPDGQVFVNPTGNPGMASGGTGDVLCGLIGGLLAQGLSTLEAAVTGVYLHGLAGDRAAERTSAAGLVASDIIDQVPAILKEWSA